MEVEDANQPSSQLQQPEQGQQQFQPNQLGDQGMTVEDLQPVDSGESIDLSQYEGQKVPIESVQTIDLESKYAVEAIEIDGKQFQSGDQLPAGKTVPSKALKVVTEKVAEVKNSNGEPVELKASELLPLKKKKDGTWGWSTNPKSKIQKLYKRLGIQDANVNPRTALVGKPVTIMVRPGDETSWLGFLI